jgi:hypothetical protein
MPATPARPGRLVRILQRVPYWAIALVALLPVLLLKQFEVLREIPWFRYDPRESIVIYVLLWGVLFLPGAIKRWKWRHVLVMLAAATLAFVAVSVVLTLSPSHYRWFLAACVKATPVVILGVAELLLNRRMSIRGLAWVLGGAVAVGVVLELAIQATTLTGWTISLPSRYGTGRYQVAGEIYWPLTVFLVWMVIPLCVRFSAPKGPRWRFAVAGFFVLIYGATAMFMEVLSYDLAERSVITGGPFDRAHSVGWLATRSSEKDMDRMWKAVEQTPWTRSKGRMSDGDELRDDWKMVAINVLASKDSAGTADHLSTLFRRQPSIYVAEDAADLFVKHRRYEAVPLLMRYALAEDSSICTDALEAMGLPMAALPIIRGEVAFEARLTGKQLTQFNDNTRKRLSRLLGEDVGLNVTDWGTLYDQIAQSVPTPLPKPIQDETNRVIAAWLVYHQAAEEWATVCFQRVRHNGLSGEAGMAEVRRLIAAVAEPNWDVLTTMDLETEVSDYASRVSKAIEEVGVDGSDSVQDKQ